MKLSVDRAIRQAATFAARGAKAEAEKLYREILQRFPANPRALAGMHALQPQPDDAIALCARGNALRQEGRLEDAVACYDAALVLKPDFIDAHNNRGNVLKNLRRFDEALAAYDALLRLRPDLGLAHFNRGLALKEAGRLDEALASYAAALRLQPDLVEAWLNHGNVLRSLNRMYEAIASYDAALRLKPDSAVAHHNRGSALQDLRRQAEALASFEMAVRLKPDFGAAVAHLLHQKALICDWSEASPDFDLAKLDVSAGAIPLFPVLALRDDPLLHLELARAWAREQSPAPVAAVPRPSAHGGKLRIGYFSADFHNHPVMTLIAGLLEAHDRSRFAVHAFSYGADRQDAMRRRAVAAVDQFHDIGPLGDREAAELARREELDVAIDLTGYTQSSRSAIFSHRAAPVQIGFLGYPGTLGAGFMDYLIADDVVIPPENRQYFAEKIISLPHSMQPNDGQRAISERRFTRAELGLPEHGFVFCCFNNAYKITPAEFDVWMRLLRQLPGSVAWLSVGGETARKNLRGEAEARGVDPDRLVFAERLPLVEDHLARHRCADLFLDTFTYNAHTTASDALWAGLPVVTKAGRSFAARVAASLLNAVGMPELVTTSAEAYERLALDLATDPERLAAIRAKLAVNRLTAPLFDTELFARHIEAAYETAFRRCVDGLPPDHIQMTASQAEPQR